jgi:hypothetical protein
MRVSFMSALKLLPIAIYADSPSDAGRGVLRYHDSPIGQEAKLSRACAKNGFEGTVPQQPSVARCVRQELEHMRYQRYV